jgi:hypothetical protein
MTWPSSPCGQVFHCDPPPFHKPKDKLVSQVKTK